MTAMNDVREGSHRWFPREILIVLALVTIVYTLFLPKSFFEFDETLFARAVLDYEPWKHHPPPPGYPLFIAVAGSLNVLVGDPFITLVALSLVASLAGLILLAHAFAAMTGSLRAGAFGAALFYLSPVMLIHGTLPISEPPALALLSLALLLFARAEARTDVPARALVFGIAAGLAIGCRPQFSIFVLPLLLGTLVALRTWRARSAAVGGFAAGCLLWFVPFVVILGGLGRFFEFELGQAAYYATHDAGISRGGWTLPRIAARFVVRPWGPLWLALPVWLLTLPGVVHLLRTRSRSVLPLIFAATAYLAFAIATMDPADGARYAIPSALGVALCAGAGIFRIARGWRGWTVFTVITACSLAYTAPLLIDRASGASPPSRAAAWIRANVPKNAVILYELPLWPHATWWLSDFRIIKIDEGVPPLAVDSETPIFIYGNGGSHKEHAHIFRWRGGHAFSKVTRNHYGVVSVVEVPPEDRFLSVRGVYGAERDPDHEWRWIAPEAEVRLPDVGAERVALRMALSRTAPEELMPVRIFKNGRLVGTVQIRRGRQTEAILPVSDGEQRIGFECESSFIPADASGGRGDPRRLCFQLLGVRQE
ncbi:MAG TPA: hypothetical protein VMS12_13225 [Thermoanaerobaculia bacterium]|nr:hypothetical protein [Thermoanaerobaculia bacterium]